MRKRAWKWALLGGALTFIILYGLEMSTAGIERIHGPLQSSSVQPDQMNSTQSHLQSNNNQASGQSNEPLIPQSVTEKKIAQLEKELEQIRKLALLEKQHEDKHDELWPIMPDSMNTNNNSAVNKFADSASGMLESASRGGIKFVVSMFEGLFK